MNIHAPSFFLTLTPKQTTDNPTNFTAQTLTMSFLARTPALRRQIVQSRVFVPSRGVHGYKVYIHSSNLQTVALLTFGCTYSTCHSTMKVQRQFSAPRLPSSFSLGSPSLGSPLTTRCMSIFWPSLSVSSYSLTLQSEGRRRYISTPGYLPYSTCNYQLRIENLE